MTYIQLDKEVAEAISQAYIFLTIDKIGHSHSAKKSNQYLVVGYPETNIRTTENTVYAGANILLLTSSNDEVYEYYNFNKQDHFLLEFAGRGLDLTTNKKSEKLADPYGMSGCGLWYISAAFDENKKLICNYMLIGVMTEFRKGKYHVLVGNRIEVLIDALINLENIQITY